MAMAKLDPTIAKRIERVLLEPRPAFTSPAEFSLYLAAQLEDSIRAREEVAYRLGEASLELRKQSQLT